jgi:hypothetical protein
VSAPAASYLGVYDLSPQLYTFGRLVGVPGSGNSYADVIPVTHCIPRAAGGNYFGSMSQGMCEYSGPAAWHGWGFGCVYQPNLTAADELNDCDADQFVLYLGRD